MKNIYLFGISIFILLVMTSFSSAATWNSSFESGLNMYFPFESNLTDSLNARTFSQSVGTSVFNASGGIYNNSVYIDVNNKINLAYNPQLGYNYTSVNFWVNNLGGAPASYVVMELGSGFAQYSAGTLYWHGICESGSAGSISFTQGKHMLTVVRNESGNYCYIDTVLDVHTTNAFNLSSIGFPYQGSNTGDKEYVDEILVYNRSLSQSEIVELYNGGTGIFPSLLPDNPPVVTLNSPADNTNLATSSITLNCSATDDFKIENISLWINGQRNYTLTGTSNFKELYISRSLPVGIYNWTCSADDNSTITQTSWGTNRTFTLSNFVLNSITFNTTTYETKSESYILNISSLDSSKLTSIDMIYNITSYSMTNLGSGIWKYTLTPSLIQNNTIIFQYTYDGVKYNSSTYYQKVNQLLFGLCNTTLNKTYLNISFKDEATNNFINASISSSTFYYYISDLSINKTLTFSNNTNNYEYDFCLLPSSESINIIYSIQYVSGSDYPQRVTQGTSILTNITTNKTLYLLSSTDGIYVTFQVFSSGNQPVSGVNVVGKRDILGVSSLVAQGTTGDDGGITFWLNPDYLHTFNFTKSGYGETVTSLFPTQTLYTITLTGISTTSKVDYSYGINTLIKPTSLLNGTHSFNYTLTTSYWLIDSFGFTLKYANGTIIGSNSSTSSTGGLLNYVANVQSGRVIMNYYYVVNSTYVNFTRYWNVDKSNAFSITHFFEDVSLYIGVNIFGINGEDGDGSFGKALISLLILIGVAGSLSFRYGINSEPAVLGLLFGLVLLLDSLSLIPNPTFMTTSPVTLGTLISIILMLLTIGFIIKGEQR